MGTHNIILVGFIVVWISFFSQSEAKTSVEECIKNLHRSFIVKLREVRGFEVRRLPYSFDINNPISRQVLDKALLELVSLSLVENVKLNSNIDIHKLIGSFINSFSTAPERLDDYVNYNVKKYYNIGNDLELIHIRELLKQVEKLDFQKNSRAALYFEFLGHNEGIVYGTLKNDHTFSSYWPQVVNKIKGEYWDLASGHSFLLTNNLEQFKTERIYRLVESSPYVSRLIKTASKLKNLNIIVETKDIRRLSKPTNPIAAIRIKNSATYAISFEKKILKLSEWLAPEGQLIFQEQGMGFGAEKALYKKGEMSTQTTRTVNLYESRLKKLMRKGWSLQFYKEREQQYKYDTIILTKPVLDQKISFEEVEARWKKMVEHFKKQ